jgi:hypothetical protein
MSWQLGFVGVGVVLAAALGCASTAIDRLGDDDGGQTGGTGGTAGIAGAAGDSSGAETRCLGAPASSGVGEGCGCNADCGFGEECLPEVGPVASSGVPGGKCINACATSEECPERFACVALTSGAPWAGCERTCATTEDCRPGYVCGPVATLVTPIEAETLPDGFFCLAWCQGDDETSSVRRIGGVGGARPRGIATPSPACARLHHRRRVTSVPRAPRSTIAPRRKSACRRTVRPVTAPRTARSRGRDALRAPCARSPSQKITGTSVSACSHALRAPIVGRATRAAASRRVTRKCAARGSSRRSAS